MIARSTHPKNSKDEGSAEAGIEKGPTEKRPSKGEPGYGRPERGSLTELRGQQAQQWAEKEVGKIIAVIKAIGNADGRVPFGLLFRQYESVSGSQSHPS
jgi:hypothetical protein